jgi:molybdopterin-binding protein
VPPHPALLRKPQLTPGFATFNARQREGQRHMKLSTGNSINGKIMEIRKGAVTAIVYVQIAGDTMLEASVTIASLEALKLYEGKQVCLMVNPGDIIIGCE